ncbi:MAG: NADH-quinone oxidoreductase subunit G, partial [Gallionella sp.]
SDNRGLQRVSDVPIYSADAVVRRAVSLQSTHDAATPCVAMHSSELAKLNARAGDTLKVMQGQASVHMVARADDGMPVSTVRVAAGHPETAGLGAMFGIITVERA